MGFAWIITEVLTIWVFFVLGRKYQDLSDILAARRIMKLIQQRKAVQEHSEMWQEIETDVTLSSKMKKEKAGVANDN